MADNCFQNEKRFEDPHDWKIAGIVCAIHVGLPILASILIWLIVQIQQRCSFETLFKMPLPPVSKGFKFWYEWSLFKNNSRSDRNESKEKLEEYNKKKKEYMDESASHEHIVVLSLVIEASIEASFQGLLNHYIYKI